MHRGKVEAANSIVDKIRKLIIDNNRFFFKGQSSRTGAKELWENVRQFKGKPKTTIGSHALSKFNADILNNHFAAISTDPMYVESDCRSTALPLECSTVCDEFDVFNLLNDLTSTSPATDGLPSWFLKLAAPSTSKPVTHLFNLSFLNATIPSQWL